MGKNSTLIYLFSNFEESELISDELWDSELKEFEHLFDFIEKNTKKVPDSIVDNVIRFAESYG